MVQTQGPLSHETAPEAEDASRVHKSAQSLWAEERQLQGPLVYRLSLPFMGKKVGVTEWEMNSGVCNPRALKPKAGSDRMSFRSM